MNKLINCCRFKFDTHAGYIVGGHEHGIQITEDSDKAPITWPMCMNLEHYYSKNQQGGRFVPRYKSVVESEHVDDQTMMVKILPYDNWQLTSTLTFKLVSEEIVQVDYDFAFADSFQDFEAFISNYFPIPDEPFIHLGGKWVQPKLADNEHRYWPRDEHGAALLTDGRFDEFYAELNGKEYLLPIADRFDYPILITPTSNQEWYIVHIMGKDDCTSLSANRTWHAHDFSLVGRDIDKGEEINCKTWMIYTKLESFDDAIKLYRDLTGEK